MSAASCWQPPLGVVALRTALNTAVLVYMSPDCLIGMC
jgi:hypothetical protein